MVDDEELVSEKSGENAMLRESIDALRLGDQVRARDLLTRLLKKDKNNPTYWVWLSAAVNTKKERIYCLQMALQADPQNTAARRGLILLGALPPDDSIPPFPVNRARLWEERLTVPQEPKERKRGWANPVVRLVAILGIAVVVIGGLFIGRPWLLPNDVAPVGDRTPPRRLMVTITFTPTVTSVFRTPTPTFFGPTPLWMFLDSTYTPTPLYVITQHSIVSLSAFEEGLRFLGAKDYPNALIQFRQAINAEPNAPDLYYYVGETYRGQSDYRSARDAYQEAINRDSTFAPAFLGRARANLGLDPNVEVINDLNMAINLDPNFAEARIARGAYLVEGNPSAAEKDLGIALEITPDSALAYLYLADAQLNLAENDAALESAIHANEFDKTLVPAYLMLGRAYIATGQAARAVSVLQTYTIYTPDDTSAFLQLGTTYIAAGEYESAVEALNKVIDANQRNSEAYFQRGTAYLNLNRPNLAETDFLAAINYDPIDFDSQLGLARAYFMQGKPGDAYIKAETNALPLAKSDGTKAQCYYWAAIFLENIPNKKGADAYWNRLIELPENAMPQEWRTAAFEHLNITPTFTPTLRPTRTPTKTP